MPDNIAVVILAAGKASRFGGCKQLADVEGLPMLQHLINAAAPLAGDIHIISGCWHKAHQTAFDNGTLHGARLHYNPHWQEGMAASIRFGVQQLAAHYSAILIMLSDQIALKPLHISQLLNHFDGKSIVCSHYNGQRGAPAIFPASTFSQLTEIKGDKGAKALLNSSAYAVKDIALDAARTDIDTKDALKAWLNA